MNVAMEAYIGEQNVYVLLAFHNGKSLVNRACGEGMVPLLLKVGFQRAPALALRLQR